jgi:hypothetical protein
VLLGRLLQHCAVAILVTLALPAVGSFTGAPTGKNQSGKQSQGGGRDERKVVGEDVMQVKWGQKESSRCSR